MTNEIMTPKEIQETQHVSYEIMQEALKQSEKRLEDFLDTKKDIERKAMFLMCFCVLFCFVIAQIFKNTNILFLIYFLLVTAIALFNAALLPMKFGTIGSEPGCFLKKDIIGGDNRTLAYVLAYITHSYKLRIDVSYKSLKNKNKLVAIGSIMIMLSIACAIYAIFFSFR